MSAQFELKAAKLKNLSKIFKNVVPKSCFRSSAMNLFHRRATIVAVKAAVSEGRWHPAPGRSGKSHKQDTWRHGLGSISTWLKHVEPMVEPCGTHRFHRYIKHNWPNSSLSVKSFTACLARAHESRGKASDLQKERWPVYV